MDKKKYVKKKVERKTHSISLRVRPSLGKWLKKLGYSATQIFEDACEELGYEVPK